MTPIIEWSETGRCWCVFWRYENGSISNIGNAPSLHHAEVMAIEASIAEEARA